METRLSAYAFGRVKAMRYQPRPPGKNPVPLVVPWSVVGLSSMLQSCGTAIRRHAESS